jgi:probable selenate reductase FAD-binding subunit
MIVEYHRPETLEQALGLLARPKPLTLPLGGGTIVNQPSPNPVAVVDLQNLGLNTIESKGKKLTLGATCTLQQLFDAPGTPPALRQAIRHQATYNLRQMATVAGTLVAADGRSPLATTLLALGAELTFQPDDQVVGLGDFLPLRHEHAPGWLITEISFPNHVQLAYDYVARTPADLPIVCVAVAQWPSGRMRVALGGYGSAPLLAMDGPEPAGAESAAQDAYHEAGDQWASAEYRRSIAATLVGRCIAALIGN